MKIEGITNRKKLRVRSGWGMISGAVGGAAIFTVALLGMTAIVQAHSGDGENPNLVHACVANKDGVTRIVGPTGSCTSKETAQHWGFRGPPGPQGPPGPPGSVTKVWTEISLAQLSQLRQVETENPLFFNGSSQKVCTTFARLFLQ